jgi:hypothetical protein
MTLVEPAAASATTTMPSIFALTPMPTAQGQYAFSIELDAEEPYLDDHRPGGDPLFSTVMAIEAAVTAARHVVSAATQASVSRVSVYKPYILTGNRPHIVDLHVVRTDDVAVALHCALSSKQAGSSVPHLEATVTFDTPTVSAPMSTPAQIHPPPQGGSMVGGAQIYQLFFHGPSFQVIDAAQYRDGEMLCRLNRELPPGHRTPGNVSQMAPRLIEFALQSAGLLDIATHGHMNIPHAIGSIQRYVPIDVDAPATLFSRASYGSSEEPHINVEIVDVSGRVILRIEEYRTVALPFAICSDALAELRAQLRGSSGTS